jgi:hypothetical protein
MENRAWIGLRYDADEDVIVAENMLSGLHRGKIMNRTTETMNVGFYKIW